MPFFRSGAGRWNSGVPMWPGVESARRVEPAMQRSAGQFEFVRHFGGDELGVEPTVQFGGFPTAQ
ncbi:hypothetical protein GCM10009608_51950 [Pseudonocardia alaniniphila]